MRGEDAMLTTIPLAPPCACRLRVHVASQAIVRGPKRGICHHGPRAGKGYLHVVIGSRLDTQEPCGLTAGFVALASHALHLPGLLQRGLTGRVGGIDFPF